MRLQSWDEAIDWGEALRFQSFEINRLELVAQIFSVHQKEGL
jgi:hypothetical protein